MAHARRKGAGRSATSATAFLVHFHATSPSPQRKPRSITDIDFCAEQQALPTVMDAGS